MRKPNSLLPIVTAQQPGHQAKPVGYCIQRLVQEGRYQTPIQDVCGRAAAEIDEHMRWLYDQWQNRLHACVRAQGGHFEQLL